MKKSILSSVLVATTLLSSIPALNSGHVAHAGSMSPLTTKGKEIQKDGKDFKIKGVNAGNVFTTESWMGGLSDNKGASDYKDLFNKIQDEGHSPKETRDLLDKFAQNRWKDKDFQNVKDMGGNTIRLPLNYINLTNYKKGMNPKDVKMRNDAFKEVDRFINKANDHGLYVIIDMHGAPGSQNNQEHSGDTHANAENGDLWEDPNLQGKAKEIWWHISEKYKNNPGVAGYDILNEPKGKIHDGNVKKQIAKFYKETIDTIRKNGDNHIAFLEATWDPINMPNPSEYPKKGKKWDENNVVYEYHNYPTEDQGRSHQGIRESFDNKVDGIKKANYNVPNYMGEFNGTSVSGDENVEPNEEDYRHIFDKMKDADMSWTLWNYDTQERGNWSPIHYKGLNVDEKSDKFGEKENTKNNDIVFNALKAASK